MPHVDEGRLHAYLDGELRVQDEAAADALEAHVAECDACAARLAEAQVLRAETAGILTDAAPGAVAAPAFEALRARAAARRADGGAAGRAGARRTRRLAWAASLAGALIIGWYARDALRFAQAEAEAEAEAVGGARDSRGAQVSEGAPDSGGAPASGGVRAAAGAGASAPGLARRRGEAQSTVEAAEVADAAPAAEGEMAPEAAMTQEAEMAPEPEMAGVPVGAEEEPALGSRQLQLEAIVVTAAPGADREPETVWRLADEVEAAVTLGRAALAVPDLEVIDIAVAADGSRAVRVRQRLATGEVLELVQTPAPGISTSESMAYRERAQAALPATPVIPAPAPAPPPASAPAPAQDPSRAPAEPLAAARPAAADSKAANRAEEATSEHVVIRAELAVVARAPLPVDILRDLLSNLRPLDR